MSFNIKALAAVFGASILSGCATTSYTPDCMERKGTAINLGIFNFESRNDKFSQECMTGKAATVFSGMRTANGLPDIKMYALAANMYAENSPEVRKHIERIRKETAGQRGSIKDFLNEDGTPDVKMYNELVNVHDALPPEAQKVYARFVNEDFGLTVDQARFDIKATQQPVECQRTASTDANGISTSGFRCKAVPQTQYAPAPFTKKQ